jgi:protease-4
MDHPTGPGFDPMTLLMGNFEPPRSFVALCDQIDEFAGDDSIQHLFLDLSDPGLGLNLAQLSELGRRVKAFRSEGRKVFAWAENAGLIHYTLAAGCDTVMMSDPGMLDFPSLSLTTLYFSDALKLLGAEASYTRSGAYKGAVEPFTRSEMSPELRAHYLEMVRSMNDALVELVAQGRGLDTARVRILQGERLFTPKAALDAGLVDRVVSSGTRREVLRELLETDVEWIEPQPKKPKPPSFFELMSQILGGATERKVQKPAIGLLHLDGQIIDGSQEMPGMIVSGPTVRTIEMLAKDPEIRGVVVRINSPGGSATASEAVRRALETLAGEKPVVISMGSLAASGGYWITCVGRPIYAETATLTGSIGVFALKLSFGELLGKVGLNLESVTLDESATTMSLERPWTPAEEERLQSFVDGIYADFLERVAGSRGLTVETVESIAGGRVWSGVQARQLKLVDHLGGIGEAVAAVAEDAGLDPGYDVIHYPRPRTMFELLGLFDTPGENIAWRLDSTSLRLLRTAGFDLATPTMILHESLRGGAPRAWLLAPNEWVIR